MNISQFLNLHLISPCFRFSFCLPEVVTSKVLNTNALHICIYLGSTSSSSCREISWFTSALHFHMAKICRFYHKSEKSFEANLTCPCLCTNDPTIIRVHEGDDVKMIILNFISCHYVVNLFWSKPLISAKRLGKKSIV
jgi:hypothetical protein